MKKNLILKLLLAAMLTVVPAEARLYVYSCRGHVELKSGQLWCTATVRTTLSPDSRFRISEGAVIEVLDSDTRRIYTSTAIGETTVKELMDCADDQAEAVLAATGKSMAKNVATQANASQTFKRGGVSMHTTEASSSDSLSLTTLFACSDYDDQGDVVLIRKENSADRERFYFSVFNCMDHSVYVNIAASPQRPLQFLLPVNVVAAPRCETSFPQYVFSTPSTPASYALIACDSDFTPTEATALLDKVFRRSISLLSTRDAKIKSL